MTMLSCFGLQFYMVYVYIQDTSPGQQVLFIMFATFAVLTGMSGLAVVTYFLTARRLKHLFCLWIDRVVKDVQLS
jgi:hypothetical protein